MGLKRESANPFASRGAPFGPLELHAPRAPRQLRVYDIVLGLFVAVLLCSNLIGPGKVAIVFGIAFGVGNIFFPISYVFGDVLTEVYGYSLTRRAIWTGFAAMLFASGMAWVIIHLPPSPHEPYNEVIQPGLEVVFGQTPRVVVASMLAFLAGDFANSYVMSRMKILTGGRWLWTRTIGSTVVGQGVDSVIFYPIAFGDKWSASTLVSVVLANWMLKVGVEALLTPVTYAVVRKIKRIEQLDAFDYDVNYNPFAVRTAPRKRRTEQPA